MDDLEDRKVSVYHLSLTSNTGEDFLSISVPFSNKSGYIIDSRFDDRVLKSRHEYINELDLLRIAYVSPKGERFFLEVENPYEQKRNNTPIQANLFLFYKKNTHKKRNISKLIKLESMVINTYIE